jgi:hypothetical protein
MNISIWDNEAVDADLRARWLRPSQEISATRIANEMSLIWRHPFSKNAIIGRAHRLGLPLRSKSRPQRQGKPLPPRPPKPKPPAPEPPAPVPLAPLHACCWPTSDGRPWRFCGQPALPNKPYCAEHHRLSYARQPGIAA